MVLVVSGTGCFAALVGEQLLAEQRSVRVMAPWEGAETRVESLGAEVAYGDPTDPDALLRACENVDQVVVGVPWPGDASNVSRRAALADVRALIDAACQARVAHFVLVSRLGADERHPLAAWRRARALEHYLKASGLSATVVRPAPLMEPVVAWLIRRILTQHWAMIPGSGTAPINLVAAADVVHYVLVALFHPGARGRVIEVGGPENLSADDMLHICERVAGCRTRCLHLPLWALRAFATALRPVDAAASGRLALALHLAGDHSTFDPSATLADFPLRLTRFEEVVRQRALALGSRAGERAAGPPAA